MGAAPPGASAGEAAVYVSCQPLTLSVTGGGVWAGTGGLVQDAVGVRTSDVQVPMVFTSLMDCWSLQVPVVHVLQLQLSMPSPFQMQFVVAVKHCSFAVSYLG